MTKTTRKSTAIGVLRAILSLFSWKMEKRRLILAGGSHPEVLGWRADVSLSKRGEWVRFILAEQRMTLIYG